MTTASIPPTTVTNSSSISSYVHSPLPPSQPVHQKEEEEEEEEEEEPLWGPLLMELVGGDPLMFDDVTITSMGPEVTLHNDIQNYRQTSSTVDNHEVTSGGVSSESSATVVDEGELRRRKRNGRRLFMSNNSKKGRFQLASSDGDDINSRRASPAPKPKAVPSPTRGLPWTEQEHRMFLWGLQSLGKGDWKTISRDFVPTRSPTQVASHAQKFYIRHGSEYKRHRRPSIHDITSVNDPSPFAAHHFYNPPQPPLPHSLSTAPSNFYDEVLALYNRNNKNTIVSGGTTANENAAAIYVSSEPLMVLQNAFRTPMLVQGHENVDFFFHQRRYHDEEENGEVYGVDGGLPLAKFGEVHTNYLYYDYHSQQQQ